LRDIIHNVRKPPLIPALLLDPVTEMKKILVCYRAAAGTKLVFPQEELKALNIDETANNTTVTIRGKLKLEGNIEAYNN